MAPGIPLSVFDCADAPSSAHVAQIDKLVDLPGIREVAELPLVSGLLAGFLPQLVLRLFFSLMPTILALLERLEGLPAESEVEWGVVQKYFSFQARTLLLYRLPCCACALAAPLHL